MSRSYKKAIYKDSGLKDIYHRRVRSRTNQVVREIVNNRDKEFEIPNPKQIMNDYNYSDYTIDYEYQDPTDDKWRKKLQRK